MRNSFPHSVVKGRGEVPSTDKRTHESEIVGLSTLQIEFWFSSYFTCICYFFPAPEANR